MSQKFLQVQGILITICGMRQLPDYAPHGITHVVSIHDAAYLNDAGVREQVAAHFPRASVHFSFFDDTPDATHSDAPTLSQIREILSYTEPLKAGDVLLVHCAMGISRSTATAYAILCQHSDPGQELACYEAMLKGRKGACPNRLVVQWADSALARNGTMSRVATEAFERTLVSRL